jgi:phage terminase large subunit
MFQRTTTINKILAINARKKVIQGGTSAGKTFGILPILIDKAARTPNLEISVVSETIPHLRRGALKDFLKIMIWTNRYVDAHYNKSLLIYRFANGSYIEFFSAEQEEKLRGARRNILYINECNNLPFEAYHQLAIRTSHDIYLDYNPTREFWAHTEVLKEPDAELLIVTYEDNEALPPNVVSDLMIAKKKAETSDYWKNWWRVYGLGLVGTLDGVIFPNFNLIDEFPKDCKWIAYGQDFGFTNDPSALIKVGYINGEIWLQEMIYQKGLTNQDLSNKYKEIGIKPLDEIFADSAEPKSIEELKREGWRGIKPTLKGKDSVNTGIGIMQSHKINITKDSTNLIKEFRNYQWEKDNDGKTTNKPIDDYNHGIDAVRYVCLMKILKKKSAVVSSL